MTSYNQGEKNVLHNNLNKQMVVLEKKENQKLAEDF